MIADNIEMKICRTHICEQLFLNTNLKIIVNKSHMTSNQDSILLFHFEVKLVRWVLM